MTERPASILRAGSALGMAVSPIGEQSISRSDGTFVSRHPSVHLGPPARSGGGGPLYYHRRGPPRRADCHSGRYPAPRRRVGVLRAERETRLEELAVLGGGCYRRQGGRYRSRAFDG